MIPDLRPAATATDYHPRRAAIEHVFGRLTGLPITQWLPHLAHIQGLGTRRIYLLDLTRLSLEEHERLVAWICDNFPVGRAEVEQDLAANGFPLLADDLIVAIPMRLII